MFSILSNLLLSGAVASLSHITCTPPYVSLVFFGEPEFPEKQ